MARVDSCRTTTRLQIPTPFPVSHPPLLSQRLALELFAEAYVAHRTLAEPSRETAVYVGVSQLEYARISLETGAAALSTYYATGAHLSVAPGKSSAWEEEEGKRLKN